MFFQRAQYKRLLVDGLVLAFEEVVIGISFSNQFIDFFLLQDKLKPAVIVSVRTGDVRLLSTGH